MLSSVESKEKSLTFHGEPTCLFQCNLYVLIFVKLQRKRNEIKIGEINMFDAEFLNLNKLLLFLLDLM